MSLAIDADLVEVGCSVFALDLNDDTDADVRSIRGGVVIAIETGHDRETGEQMRRFVTATPWQGHIRFDALLASELGQVVPPNTSVIRSLIRAMAKVVASSKRVMTTDEARCISAQAALMEVLA